MPDIIVDKVNESFYSINCDNLGILKELSDYMSFKVPNAHFMGTYKMKLWDGKIRLFQNHLLPIGLFERFKKFISAQSYSVQYNYNRETTETNVEEVKEICNSLLTLWKHTIRDDQVEAIYKAIKYSNGVIQMPTGSGKSICLYILALLRMHQTQEKVLIIVPSVSLVEQLYGDFKDYGCDVYQYVDKIYSGQIQSKKNITISTWQSLQKKSPEYLEQFSTLLIDECFKAGSLVKTNNGDIKIEDIKPGDSVLSYNVENDTFEYKNVIRTFNNRTISNKLLKITLDDDTIIECTPNHKFYVRTENGIILKEAYLLTEDDDLISCTYPINMKIKKIEIFDNTENTVYDLEIEDNHNYFVNNVLVSNCHGAKADVINKIAKKCINASMRIGLTGTMPIEPSEFFSVCSFLGPVIFQQSTKDLMDLGILSDMTVVNLQCVYPAEIKGHCYNRDYDSEMAVLESYTKRMHILDFIFDKAIQPGENSIVLVKHIKHLEATYNYLSKKYPSKKIYKWYQEIKPLERERIRAEIEVSEDMIIVGSFATIATGINMKKLHHVIFFIPYKSHFKVLQALGRGLRLHASKTKLILWDCIDDLRTKISEKNTYNNHAWKHSEIRTAIYTQQKFEVINKKLIL